MIHGLSVVFVYILDLLIPGIVQYVQKAQTCHASKGSDHVLSNYFGRYSKVSKPFAWRLRLGAEYIPEFNTFDLTMLPDFWKHFSHQIIPFNSCISKCTGDKHSDDLLLAKLQTFSLPPYYLLLQLRVCLWGVDEVTLQIHHKD